jgi:hypothetical protein
MRITPSLLMLVLSVTAQAQSGTRLKAFDGTIHLTMSTTGKDNFGSVSAGITGRRMPLSVLVGIGYAEFDEHYQDMGLSKPCVWSADGTVMLRALRIDFHNMDLNGYATVHKGRKSFLSYGLEYGGSIGTLVNDKSRLYLNVGYRRGFILPKDQTYSYSSMIYGVTFALLFFNGDDGYTLHNSINQ